MQPGEVFTDGMQQIFPLGDEPVEILEVASRGEGDLQFLGAMIAGPERTENFQTLPGFPPETGILGEIVQAKGSVLKPLPPEVAQRGYSLLLGYKVGRDLRSVRDDVTVKYRVAGQERVVRYLYAMAICTSGKNDDCESPVK
jgi:hypothetical protein